MYAKPVAPLPIGGVLDDAIKLYRESFAHCWLIALLTSLVRGAFGIATVLYIRPVLQRPTPAALLHVYQQPPVAAGYLLYVVLSIALFGALIASQAAVANGRPVSTGAALGIGFGRLGRAVLASIVLWVVVVVGLVLFIVPGIYLIGSLCLWAVALYADDAGALQSLSISRALVKGHWWRTATILGVAVIIILVFGFILGAVGGAFAVVARGDVVSFQLIIQVVSIIGNVFLVPAIPAVLVGTFRDLQLRREGGDLAARLGALPPG